ncbi:MFS general substrate transporter [Serendipita vermifera]|nr:MFS general substrate transporter [Serendipita vermifera]
MNWMMFLCAFLGWTWDAFDFFTVSLTVTDLAEEFGKSKSDITWGITLVLMLRSVGAITFGLAADRYGRKWPWVVNNILFIVFELATGFCNTYEQFLGVRACFGIAMGGLYGNAAATALEDVPYEARGIVSGMLQQGYAFGYLLAVVFARALVNTTSHGWRPLFWFGACPPVLLIIFRLCLPETQAFQRRMEMRQKGDGIEKTFIREGKIALKRYWLMLIYLVLMMTGFNFMSHGSQDLYPTMLQNQLQFSADAVTVTQVIANLGAITGGTIVGYCSEFFGRRLSIISSMCILGGALLYPYGFLKDERIAAVAFFEQFAVQGAWGVVPIHLMELSPGSFRTFVVGTSYQLGNLVSSASSTIEAKLGERFPLPPTARGVSRYVYGKVIAIFMACVYVYLLILIILGPERKDRKMEEDDGLEEATHAREIRDPELGNEDKKVDPDRSSSATEEKHREQVVENVKA